MTKRKFALAIAGLTLLAASPAFAQPPHWAPAHGWRAQHHHYYPARPAFVVVQPRPYVYYVPAPAVLYPPLPVYPNWGVNINFRL